MENKIKTIFFASLIAAMILPFNMMDVSATTEKTNNIVIDKAEDPTEFVGTLKEETRQIGSYLLVKHTYTSSDLNLRNVDHIYREEIIPVSANMTQQEIDDMVKNPDIVTSHEMEIVHETETTKIDKIKSDSELISAEVFHQWNIVEIPDSTPTTSPVSYDSSIRPVTTTIEDWASTKDGKVYTAHDPINLVWKDTVSTRGDSALIDKVETKIKAKGWNDLIDNLCFLSNDLYVNISGTWTKQSKHFKDQIWLTPCEQYHVRAWAINDNLIIGAAHKEAPYLKPLGKTLDIKHDKNGVIIWERDVDGSAHHILHGFDSAEDEAAGEFTGGCWSVSQDSRDLNNSYTRTYYESYKSSSTPPLSTADNDGSATEITCS